MLRSIADLQISVVNISPAIKNIPTGYIIRVKLGKEKWYVCKRYSALRSFWNQMIYFLRGGSNCPDRHHFLKGLELERFPSKESVKYFCMKNTVIRKRLVALNRLLERTALRLRTCSREALLDCERVRCPISELIKCFFEFPDFSIPAGVIDGDQDNEQRNSSNFSDWRGFSQSAYDENSKSDLVLQQTNSRSRPSTPCPNKTSRSRPSTPCPNRTSRRHSLTDMTNFLKSKHEENKSHRHSFCELNNFNLITTPRHKKSKSNQYVFKTSNDHINHKQFNQKKDNQDEDNPLSPMSERIRRSIDASIVDRKDKKKKVPVVDIDYIKSYVTTANKNKEIQKNDKIQIDTTKLKTMKDIPK